MTESGLLATMVDYWHYTGDATYNDVVAHGLLSQASPTDEFITTAHHFGLVRLKFTSNHFGKDLTFLN